MSLISLPASIMQVGFLAVVLNADFQGRGKDTLWAQQPFLGSFCCACCQVQQRKHTSKADTVNKNKLNLTVAEHASGIIFPIPHRDSA
jgi:hypothetical protein